MAKERQRGWRCVPRKNKAGKVIGYRGSYWVHTAEGPKRRYVSGKNKGETRQALAKAKGAKHGSKRLIPNLQLRVCLSAF